MSISYILGSEENKPNMFDVEKSVSPCFSNYLRVAEKAVIGYSDNHIRTKVCPYFSSKLKRNKKISSAFQSYDYDTLDMLGQI